MNPSNFVPVLPDNAPFTAEQRAYLNGFLAGLFSRAPQPNLAPPTPDTKPLTPLTILFGSQTGNTENLSKRIAKEAGKRGFAPTVQDLGKYATAQLVSESALLVVTSTYGDGEPPDNAKGFWDFLNSAAAPKLAQSKFSVLALGDSNYPKFCAFGKAVDERLEKLGATRVHPRTDCDVEYEEPFAKWLNGALAALSAKAPDGEKKLLVISNQSEATVTPAAAALITNHSTTTYSKSHPFPAPLLANVRLNGDGSAKDTRHFAFSLDGSGLGYEAGDALGVRATNCAELVEELLRALGRSGEEPVPDRDGKETPLRDALIHHYEITRIPTPLLKAVTERSGDAELQKLTAPGTNGELTKFLWGREIIDLLHAHPTVKFTPTEFVALLKKLQPRLYSISSSPKAHPGEVHLCVGVVRYDSFGRSRKGVCSTFLAERVPTGGVVPVFVHHNKNFRPPANPDAPMIMVGPGTGIAPFRAFLEERRAAGAKGKNWLFFGDQRAATDYLFREEIEVMQRDGTLSRLDLAFSRDQAEKIYVQNRMTEHAKELYAWLQEGGGFYVCGDASRMAKDVDAALHQVIQTAGGKSAEEATAYVAALKKDKRYQRDVY
ncbi:MAG: sulfite reductase subunit alpha [Proteobacteria bacterium]|nr:sulfite reductase subunit alpha [Pseudomonadota bacterium]